jgi:uncharacterized hydantoinase/oxoprolinase family protein
MMRPWLALDIGGANLKAADGHGFAVSHPFALWMRREELATAIGGLIEASPPAERLAVTMTGELADCYQTKDEGVRHILNSVARAAAGRDVFVYLVTGELVPIDARISTTQHAAASNWHALATFACRYVARPPQPPPSASRDFTASPVGRDLGRAGSEHALDRLGLVIDVGSTTTDIVPITARGTRTKCRSDVQRLLSGELVYTGVRRSPVCGLVREFPWRDGTVPVAQEFFATTADVYVLLGDLPEDPEDRGTADGRPLTQAAAQARMARMICLDRDSFSLTDAVRAAESRGRRVSRPACLRRARDAHNDAFLGGSPRP